MTDEEWREMAFQLADKISSVLAQFEVTIAEAAAKLAREIERGARECDARLRTGRAKRCG